MRCFLDIDGVLTDFPRAANKFFNRNIPFERFNIPNFTSEMGMPIQEIDSQFTRYFWSNLPWLPTGKSLLALVEACFGKENVCLFTFPSYNSEAASGKVMWIMKNLPQYRDRFLIGTVKHFCASINTILIDDKESNIEKFEQAGGLGILVPAPWNCLASENVIEYVDNQLTSIRSLIEERSK